MGEERLEKEERRAEPVADYQLATVIGSQLAADEGTSSTCWLVATTATLAATLCLAIFYHREQPTTC